MDEKTGNLTGLEIIPFGSEKWKKRRALRRLALLTWYRSLPSDHSLKVFCDVALIPASVVGVAILAYIFSAFLGQFYGP